MTTQVSLSNAGSRRRGFTLTEIAIVLGIIGLILGAIWVAASAVYNNMRTSRASQELLQITQQIRSMFATQTTTGLAAGADMTPNLITAGAFPNDMLANGTASASATNPWGGTTLVASQTATVAGDAFSVTFNAVPQGPCINILVSNTGQGRDSAMIGAGAAVATNTVFPLNLAQATTACGVAGAAGNPVVFTFRLRT